MKSIIILFLFSVCLYGQNGFSKTTNQEKIKTYEYLDSINTSNSKDFPTRLAEGSGFLKKKNKKIGSIGFEIETTKNADGKIIRIKKSQSNHYIKLKNQTARTKHSEITIYFDGNQNPDLAKYITETYIAGKLIKRETEFYNLKENSNEDNFKSTEIRNLLEEIKN